MAAFLESLKTFQGGAARDQIGARSVSQTVRSQTLVGTSGTSVSDAIQNAIARVTTTVRNVKWFEVVQVRGEVKDGKVGHYQVTLKIGFTLDDG